MQGFRVALQLILFLLSVWGPGGAGVVLIDHKGFLIPTIVLMIAAVIAFVLFVKINRDYWREFYRDYPV